MSDSVSVDKNGAELLARFLEENNIGREEAASALGVTRITLWSWIQRESVPLEPVKEDIATWTRGAVPIASWPVVDRRRNPPHVEPFEPKTADDEVEN